MGIFATKANIAAAYGPEVCPSVGNEDGWQLAAQLTGVVCTVLWVGAWSTAIFLALKHGPSKRFAEHFSHIGAESGAQDPSAPADQVSAPFVAEVPESRARGRLTPSESSLRFSDRPRRPCRTATTRSCASGSWPCGWAPWRTTCGAA